MTIYSVLLMRSTVSISVPLTWTSDTSASADLLLSSHTSPSSNKHSQLI